MKNCPKCKTLKEDTEFFIKRHKTGTIGLRSYCKICSAAERDEYRKTSPQDNERNKAYNKANASEIRGKKLVKNYWPDMTWQEATAEWQRMFDAQGGRCAFGHVGTKLHVDHCHATGKVRGLLCYNCNSGLGRFKDNAEVMQQAIKYLKNTA